MNKLKQFSVGIIVFLCFLLLAGCSSTEKTSSQKQETTSEQIVQLSPTSENELKTSSNAIENNSTIQEDLPYNEWLKKTITEAIGDKTNYDKPRIESIIFFDKEKTDMEITLWADDNLTPGFIRDGAIVKSTEVFHQIFADPRANNVLLYWLFPAKDVYGNNKEMVILQVKMTRKTANKINWSDFDPLNLETVADKFHVHPSLQ
jgi:outer membrane murein-binding lipoprotein Lpp